MGKNEERARSYAARLHKAARVIVGEETAATFTAELIEAGRAADLREEKMAELTARLESVEARLAMREPS